MTNALDSNNRGRLTPRGIAPPPTRAAPPRRRGFTLLEAALSTIIIGVGVLAVVEAQMSFLERNNWSTHGSTATYLAGEIREMTKNLPRHDRFTGGIYFLDEADPETLTGWGIETGEADPIDLDDLDDFDGAVFGDATDYPEGFAFVRRFSGPINATGQVIHETMYNGTTLMLEADEGEDPTPVALRGWSQLVTVEKVDPAELTEAVADNEVIAADGQTLRRVDRFPVRVTVTVVRQQTPESSHELMTTVSWIVMP